MKALLILLLSVFLTGSTIHSAPPNASTDFRILDLDLLGKGTTLDEIVARHKARLLSVDGKSLSDAVRAHLGSLRCVGKIDRKLISSSLRAVARIESASGSSVLIEEGFGPGVLIGSFKFVPSEKN